MEKAIALLSGGIDSPVAIKLMQDRVDVIAVHFHQEELTGPEETEKVKALLKVLGIKKGYLIPFTLVLKEIVDQCEHKNYFILQKILMFKAAELIAEKEGAKYLITGENLGQVSSQTLSNLSTITKHIKLEIFRPVLTFDKQEIIDQARAFDTYEISSGPEICNLLGPKSPATRSDSNHIAKELGQFNMALVDESLKKAVVISS
jgi:tRNA uracil 4-sulfurtransferase